MKCSHEVAIAASKSLFRAEAIRIEEALKQVSFCWFGVENKARGKLYLRKRGKMHR